MMCNSNFWGNAVAIAVILVVEYFIGKSQKIESSSIIEVVLKTISKGKKWNQ